MIICTLSAFLTIGLLAFNIYEMLTLKLLDFEFNIPQLVLVDHPHPQFRFRYEFLYRLCLLKCTLDLAVSVLLALRAKLNLSLKVNILKLLPYLLHFLLHQLPLPLLLIHLLLYNHESFNLLLPFHRILLHFLPETYFGL